MAKYYELGIADVSFFAGGDYSASANRYTLGYLSSASNDTFVTPISSASLPVPIGVLQNSPCQNEEARVRVMGFTKLRCDTVCGFDMGSSSPIYAGDFLTATSIGYGRKAGGAASPAFARAMESIASGSAIINVLLLPLGVNAIAAC